jgi:hypothetical protein
MIVFAAAALASAGLGQIEANLYLGRRRDEPRPIATAAPYPAGMADDVRRPGFNGRMWVTRPIIGGMDAVGGWAVSEGDPGASAYGAFDRQDATVYVRVVHTVIGVNAWEQIDKPGLAHLEHARQFWLRERGYTGGVRTFVNDAVLWNHPQGRDTREADASPSPLIERAGEIQPRATIRVPAEWPRTHRIRVEATPPAGSIASLPGNGPARVSLPPSAPKDMVERIAASDAKLPTEPVQTVATRAN